MDGVTAVYIQFSFSNGNAVPLSLRDQGQESQDSRNKRRKMAPGVQVLKETEKVSLVDFLEDLTEDYTLGDAYHQVRTSARQGERPYHVVRYNFYPKGEVCTSVSREDLRPGLQDLLAKNAWRARAYLNPRYRDQVLVEGERSLCINLEARVPLFRPDGNPVTQWRKDSQGERIGAAPVPLAPSAYLRLAQDGLRLT